MAIALREGWPAKYPKRGGQLGVIELWIEGRQMIEGLTAEMQAEHLATVTIDNWRAMLTGQHAGLTNKTKRYSRAAMALLSQRFPSRGTGDQAGTWIDCPILSGAKRARAMPSQRRNSSSMRGGVSHFS